MLRRTIATIPAAAMRASPLAMARRHGSCPFSGGASPTVNPEEAAALGVAAQQQQATASCPMMGTLPAMKCPVEEVDRQMPMSTVVNVMGKHRLSGFVTATAVVGYVMAGGTNPLVAAMLTGGTYLQSMSANTANQTLEVEYDKMMKRTCKRPLAIGRITRRDAALLSATELATGTAILYAVSPMAAGLGAVNWFMYVGMYTPLKRISPVNTWFGSIVGGLPPLMGGVAATSGLLFAPAMGPTWLLGGFMLAWQIPHFMALSFHCRRDYESAGFKMLAFKNPWRASFYAVSVSLLMTLLCVFGPLYLGEEIMPVEAYYWPVALAANGVMTLKSINFHMDPKGCCRSCFVFSYAYLAVMLALFTVNHFQPVSQLVKLANSFENGELTFTTATATTGTAAALTSEKERTTVAGTQ